MWQFIARLLLRGGIAFVVGGVILFIVGVAIGDPAFTLPTVLTAMGGAVTAGLARNVIRENANVVFLPVVAPAEAPEAPEEPLLPDQPEEDLDEREQIELLEMMQAAQAEQADQAITARNLRQLEGLYPPEKIQKAIETNLQQLSDANPKKATLLAQYQALQEMEERFFNPEAFKRNYGIEPFCTISDKKMTTPVYMITALRPKVEEDKVDKTQEVIEKYANIKYEEQPIEKNIIYTDLLKKIVLSDPETKTETPYPISPFTRKIIVGFGDVSFRSGSGKIRSLKQEIKKFMDAYLANLTQLAQEIKQEIAAKQEKADGGLPVVHSSPISQPMSNIVSTPSQASSSASSLLNTGDEKSSEKEPVVEFSAGFVATHKAMFGLLGQLNNAILQFNLLTSLEEKQTEAIKKQQEEINLQLHTVAAAQGYDCVNVPDDNNCQFHAIVEQLKLCKDELTAKGYGGLSTLTHEDLRKRAVQVINRNRIHFEPYIEGGIDAYLTKMEKTGEWGDHFTLFALSQALNVNIVVLQANGGTISYPVGGVLNPNALATLRIGYNGYNHYWSLKPKDVTAELTLPLPSSTSSSSMSPSPSP